MIQDLQNVFFNKKTLVTANVGDAVLSEILDTRAIGAPTGASWVVPVGTPWAAATDGYKPKSVVGEGNPVAIEASITETATSTGAATAKLELLQSAAADMSNPDVIWDSGDIAKGTLVAGYRFKIRWLPPEVVKRYVAFRYTNGTEKFSAGKISAFLLYERVNP